MDDHTRKRIEQQLREYADPDSDCRKRFDAARQKWDRELKPSQDAIRATERITERDLRIIINAAAD